MSVIINHHEIVDIIRANSDQHIMPYFQQLRTDQVFMKNGNDIVTMADLAMEQGLIDDLQKYLPQARIIGEESYQKNPELFQQLANNQWLIMIDPIDGTRNFADGKDEFCVLVALYHYGQVVWSFTYVPITGQCAIAELGGGAYWQNGSKITRSIAPNLAVNQSIGQANFIIFPEEERTHLKAQFLRTDRLRCAGLDFLSQATGERHFSLYRHLWWWDHAAGCFLLQESGGKVGLLNQNTYNPCENGRLLLTATHDYLYQQLQNLFSRTHYHNL